MAEKTKVTRISAKEDGSKSSKTVKTARTGAPKVKAVKAKVVKTKQSKQSARKTQPADDERKRNVLVRIGRYFKGAWVELKQVRWPTRKATWGLTIAVTLFSAFFVGVILLLDALFQWLFDFIIG